MNGHCSGQLRPAHPKQMCLHMLLLAYCSTVKHGLMFPCAPSVSGAPRTRAILQAPAEPPRSTHLPNSCRRHAVPFQPYTPTGGLNFLHQDQTCSTEAFQELRAWQG